MNVFFIIQTLAGNRNDMLNRFMVALFYIYAPNVPIALSSDLDRQYSEWTDRLVCEGSWPGKAPMCDCYENALYNSENLEDDE